MNKWVRELSLNYAFKLPVEVAVACNTATEKWEEIIYDYSKVKS